ncbi:RmlC-like cupin domain-containing protein [Gymnopilus junonius]|uniref:RmlC-like cupin domain-containing protein n=1 Tax=Gymnopilus junonius TaxID=109634 RepID=A0A9P5TQX7_GYMJU|nr:RmlC-like cupin domain-containing protein [Gymnopilus junonius]
MRHITFGFCLCLLQLITAFGAPTVPLQPDIPYANSDPNNVLWTPASGKVPRPERAGMGGSILGPQNIPLDLQNADLLAPPSTDNGDVDNYKWPFSLSHNRIMSGGWSRQQNVHDMYIAEEIAGQKICYIRLPCFLIHIIPSSKGVNMRLEPGAIREMHWHNTAEWAYVLKGDLRISTITPDGDVWLGDVSEGDLWYFPAGNPHSIQAKDKSPGGAEFIIIFDAGNFSEDSTFLLTDWLAHVPKSVVAKNFGLGSDLKSFDHIPEDELYIFPSSPPVDDVNKDMVVPNSSPVPYSFKFSKVIPENKQGGTVKVVDSRTFTASEKIAAAEVVLDVGGLRELHWHPTQPEWTFFISGQARITLYAASSNAATYDFYPGDIAYIPPSFGHYIENIGNTPLKFLEILKTDIFQDISLTQWLALTPPALVKAHLGFSDELINSLKGNTLERSLEYFVVQITMPDSFET